MNKNQKKLKIEKSKNHLMNIRKILRRQKVNLVNRKVEIDISQNSNILYNTKGKMKLNLKNAWFLKRMNSKKNKIAQNNKENIKMIAIKTIKAKEKGIKGKDLMKKNNTRKMKIQRKFSLSMTNIFMGIGEKLNNEFTLLLKLKFQLCLKIFSNHLMSLLTIKLKLKLTKRWMNLMIK